MLRTSFFLLAFPLIALVGCPSSGSAPAGTDACTRLFDALNASSARCGSAPVSRNRDAAIRDCTITLGAPGTTYGNYFDACIAALAAEPCDTISALSEPGGACATPAGTLATGSGCVSVSQCQSLHCSHEGSVAGKPSYCGTCVAAAAAGEPCSLGQAGPACATGTKCIVNADAGTSTTGTCAVVPRSQVGEACGGTSGRSCAAGLNCKNDKCVARAPAGASCAEANCSSGLYCNEQKVCAPAPKAGDPCVLGMSCPSGLACVSSKCVSVVYAKGGESCDGKAIRCLEGSCAISTGINDSGAPTETTGKCPNVLAEGAACHENDPSAVCPEPTECYAGACQIADPAKCL